MHLKPLSRLMLTGLMTVMISTAPTRANDPEISQDDRKIAATAALAEIDQAVTVYVKGLCCPSCAIGIRKKVSKLDFIDTLRLNKGVTLDTKTQLATLALKDKQIANPFSLAKAIQDAGYTPVHMYQMQSGKLEMTTLPTSK